MSLVSQSPVRYRYKVLVDRIERLGQVRGVDYRAILMDFRNTPFAKSIPHTRLAMHLIQDEFALHEGESHRLGDHFLACLCDPKGVEVLKPLLGAVFALAPGQPWGAGEGDDSFVTSMEIRTDKARLIRQIDRVQDSLVKVEQEAERQKMRAETAAIAIPLNGAVAAPSDDPFSTGRFPPTIQLEFIESQLQKVRFLELMRSQPICRFDNGILQEVIGQEIYTSIADVQKRFSTAIDMAGNYQLRHHLAQHLDGMLLGALKDLRLRHHQARVHINMTLSSLKSAPFRDFEASFAEGEQRPALEFNITDLLGNARAFRRMAPTLQERGFALVADGISLDALTGMEVDRLPIAAAKIIWSAERACPEPALRRLEQLRAKNIRVILCRCDRKSALELGKAMGIEYFQGAAIDELASLDFHGGCAAAERLKCTADRCRNLHWALHRMASLPCPRPQWISPKPA